MSKKLSQYTLSLFLSAALLLNFLAPAGFMPDLEALGRGTIRITICSSYGPRQITLDQNQHEKSDKKTGKGMCAFGATPNFALAALCPACLFIARLADRPSVTEEAFTVALVTNAAWPRGPPTL